MNQIFVLPDGTQVGTGLQVPTSLSTSFPAYETSGSMLPRADVEAVAKAGTARGRDRFDKTFIKSQGKHGSCQGFASALALTRARVRRGQERVDLSGAFAYSLVNGGRDNGSMLEDGLRVSESVGYATEATVPWDAIYPSRYDRAKAMAEAARFRGFEVYSVRTELALLSALASGFDCVVAVHADNAFMKLDARGVAGYANGPGNHAVGADGLSWDGEVLVDSFNSWGLSYGREGRMYLTWDHHLTQTNKYHNFYAMRSTLDDPQGNNPPPVTP